jgi:hypothetical protein
MFSSDPLRADATFVHSTLIGTAIVMLVRYQTSIDDRVMSTLRPRGPVRFSETYRVNWRRRGGAPRFPLHDAVTLSRLEPRIRLKRSGAGGSAC